MEFNSLKATEPLRVSGLLFTTKFQEIPGTYLTNSEWSKAEATLEPPNGFEHGHGTLGLGIQHLNH